jgi:regulatory protein
MTDRGRRPRGVLEGSTSEPTSDPYTGSGVEPYAGTGMGSGTARSSPAGGRRAKRERRSPRERDDDRAAARRARQEKAVADDPAAVARELVLNQLTMGPRTRAQLRKVMARREIPEEVAAAVLDRFEEVDLIDDKEFARQWVQSRHLGRGLARRALAYELRQRGIADETVKDAVDEVSSDDELAAARELVRRKATSMRNDDPQRRVRRLAGMLARKGYGGAIAMQAIREELAELALDDPGDADFAD